MAGCSVLAASVVSVVLVAPVSVVPVSVVPVVPVVPGLELSTNLREVSRFQGEGLSRGHLGHIFAKDR